MPGGYQFSPDLPSGGKILAVNGHPIERQPNQWQTAALLLAMLVPVLLSLNLLADLPFHHDEALYARWAWLIASGQNVWLAETPIDKPPLFLYTLAAALRLLGPSETAARLPSLLATMATVGLTFRLGRRLYGPDVGLLAAWLTALSPFTVMFAPTALTDPLLTALVLAGCAAAVEGRLGRAGVWLGLAAATKQQGLLFAPLPLALAAAVYLPRMTPRQTGWGAVRYTAGLAAVQAAALAWDAARHQSPGYWQLSAINYGGLSLETGAVGERLHDFLALLGYAAGSPVLVWLFAAGLPVLVGVAGWRYFRARGRPGDQGETRLGDPIGSPLLVLYAAGFLLGHAVFSFQVWDRYLLGLVPLLALLLARLLFLPWEAVQASGVLAGPERRRMGYAVYVVGLSLFLAWTMARPVQDAFYGRYPLGSHSQALRGIEQTVAFLQAHYGANTTLFHRWLGTHWRFYLRDYPYDLQFWESPLDLARRARPGHLIAFPSWQSETEARLALQARGLTLVEIHRAYNPAGYPSIVLYRIGRLGIGD